MGKDNQWDEARKTVQEHIVDSLSKQLILRKQGGPKEANA